jgi:hypothetical protein
MTPSPRTILGASRLLVGAVSLIAPYTAGRIFGIAREPAAAWVTRLFGSRELVLAAALLAAPADQVSSVAALGAGIDALDAVSSVAERSRGTISDYTLVSGGFGAVVFALLGVATLRDSRAITDG